MQSASRLPSQSHHHRRIPWEVPGLPRPRPTIHNPGIEKSKLSFPSKPWVVPSSPWKLSCEFKVGEVDGGGGGEEQKPLLLPVVICRSGRASRYVWDGARLRLVVFDREVSDRLGLVDGFRRLLQMSGLGFRGLFVPQQVQDNYMDYIKWKFLHRVFSSSLQVLATQAMFRAIGIGSSHALPSAAALNWVLKDGLGRLSRCIYTVSLGSAFDTNLKRVRFSTSVLFSLSIGVELLTPAFPQHFLLLATLANIAKSISLAAYIATRSAIHRSFAIADNLGEVSAKAQVQTVCFDNLGLLLAALLNILCKNNRRLQAGLPSVIYPIFAAVDLFAIYQGLKHVHLQTLTKDRLEIIIDTWIQSGYAPSPAEVSNKEGIDFLNRKGRKLWPIRIGCVDPKGLSSTIPKLTLQSLSCEDPYFICMETSFRGISRRRQQGILLCLRESTGTSDIIMGLLQACHIRSALLLSRRRWDPTSEASSTEGSMVAEWFKVVEDSKTYTLGKTHLLSEEIQRSGWAAKNILLSLQEAVRYSLVKDD